MPQFTSENSNLKIIVKILRHVIKTTLCSELFFLIIKTIQEYIGPHQITHKKKLFETFTQKNNNDLYDYIMNDIPKLLIKIKLKIFINEYESERFTSGSVIISIDSLFAQITSIIRTGGVLTLSDDSQLVQSLDKIYGFQKDIFNIMIPVLYTTILGFQRYLQNNHRHMKILKYMIESFKPKDVPPSLREL
jgi:hypothetical protein